jgi:glucokinase
MERRAREEVEAGEKTKLFELMKKHDRDRLTSGIWERALEDGDDLAEKLIARAERALGIAIASAINLIDPEAVILGGGMGARFADRALPVISDQATPYLFDPDDPPALRAASLGDLGGSIGAALLVSEQGAAHAG